MEIANREKVMEHTIKSICDGIILTSFHPRTAINITIQEIQNDGNVSYISFLNIKSAKPDFLEHKKQINSGLA